MSKYKIYFKLFGKKLVVEVDASCEDSAKNYIRNSIEFKKTIKIKSKDDEMFDSLKDLFEI